MTFFYPDNLPISLKREDILQTLQHHQVVIIAGDTGSGKTTQLPKMCLEYLGDNNGKIGCTQPRRIAALTVSSRVAEELGDQGRLVGSKIRFHDNTSNETRIKFMTDGVLLSEIRSDRLLKEYKVIIIDEAHERSLNIDFLLGYICRILSKRKDLKVLITSATIDTEAFSAHFHNAPVISIPGKTYPVDTRYAPPNLDEYGEPESYIDACINIVNDIFRNEPPGDILVFMPTEKDILNCSKVLSKMMSDAEVLPLFGRLQSSDQKKIFQSFHKRKIVVATNVAETSITVPGIRYVVDTGLARMSFYNSRAKTNSLPIRKISQASCDQRKGRCGRIGPGICIRLYEEEDYDGREMYTVPEIKRSNLAEVILQMTSFKLGTPTSFPFIDAPHSSAINDGYRLLMELGAMNEKKNLTPIGRVMASMPIDPCIARIIIEANSNNCLREIMIIATVLAIQDPRVRPVGMEQKADQAHEAFRHPQSDFMTLLNIWNQFNQAEGKSSWSRLKKFCKSHFLSFQRMREWIDLHEQMRKIIKQRQEFAVNAKDAAYDAIHKSLSIGFLRNIAVKKEGKIYQGPANKELMIFPGSGQFKSGGRWIIAASFLETNRLYALTVATVEPEWLEPLAGRLCKYSWSDPRYQKKTGMVIASEKVSLFGLILIPSRPVNYGRINTTTQLEARNIFIQAALVEGNITGNYPFVRKNLSLLKKWENVEHRLRTRGVLAQDVVIHQFYDKALPDWIYDRSTLNKFLKKNRNTSFLLLQESDILDRRPESTELADFPHTLTIGSHTFSLSYIFDPADPKDGVTITIPYELLPTLRPAVFEWLVPGLLKEKITFLLKSLPKKIRKHLVPINATVDRVLDDMTLYQGSLYRAIEASLFKHHKISVKNSDWTVDIPQHLLMRISLIDIKGREIVADRDFNTLSSVNRPQHIASKASASDKQKKLMKKWEETLFTQWSFKDLPEHIPLYSGSGDIAGYLYPALSPALQERGVKISFLSDRKKAETYTIVGFRYLITLHISNQFKSLKKYCSTALSGPSSMWMLHIFSSKSEAVASLLNFVVDTLFEPHYDLLFTEKQFHEKMRSTGSKNIYNEGTVVIDRILHLLRLRRQVQGEIDRHESLSSKIKSSPDGIYKKFSDLLNSILPQNFLEIYKFNDFDDIERYMKSLEIRISRAHADFAKDSRKEESIIPFVRYLSEMTKSIEDLSPECIEKVSLFKMMLQEYRVSLFSPEIKTKVSVSSNKLKKLWQEYNTSC